jgi:RNA polymerase sigma-32 factor
MALSEIEEFQQGTRAFARNAMRAPMLDAETELDLARRWRDHGDEKALHGLTEAYVRLVVSMASRFRNYGLPASDLVQEGNVGLMQAAARFEPERELRFSTYATWWIRAAMQDYILRNWSIVRTGTTSAQKTLFFNLRRMRAQIGDTSDALTHEACDAVAKKLGVGARDVAAMASRLSGPDRSLNAPLGEDGGGAWQDTLADDHLTPDVEVMQRRDAAARTQWIAEAMEHLNPREVLIIRERRLTEDGVTLDALGAKLGVSKERVRQIETQALDKLRRALLRTVADPRAAGLV